MARMPPSRTSTTSLREPTRRLRPPLDVGPGPHEPYAQPGDGLGEVGVPTPPVVDELRPLRPETVRDLGGPNEVGHVNLPGQQAQEVAGTGRLELPPKTAAGRRVVALPSLVVEALEAHLGTYGPVEPDAPLFTGPGGGPLRRATLSKAWQAAVRSAGAPDGLRPHDLRHHAATLTARMPGVTTKELMSRIGHASPRAALIYQHATHERDRAIASNLDSVVESTLRPSLAPVVGLISGREEVDEARASRQA